MKVGLDQFTLHPFENPDPFFAIDFVREHHLDGLQFGGIGQLSPGLDLGPLREIDGECRRHGLYCLTSIGSPNPILGGASQGEDQLVAQLTAQIEASAAVGWRELHSALGGFERFTHPVPWRKHLVASAGVLRRLRPMLKANGCRINIENHGESTTFELARMAEDIGPDVVGICLDTANMLCHCEDPLSAVRRAAPYTHQTHTKDAIIYFTENGYTRQGRPPGQGVVPFEQVLSILAHFNPDLCLSIEDHKWVWEFGIFDREWLALHPELTPVEMGAVARTAWQITSKIHAGEIPDPIEYEKIPFKEQVVDRVHAGRDYLRKLVAQLDCRE